MTVTEDLSAALLALRAAREIIREGNVERHREAVLREIVQAELAVSRVMALIAGVPNGRTD
jgi:hypothetical protein